MGFFYPFFTLFSIPKPSQNHQGEKPPQQKLFQQFLPIIFQQEPIWLRYIHTGWFCSLIEASSQIMLLKQQMRLFTKKKSLYPCSKRLLASICLSRITQEAPKNGILQFWLHLDHQEKEFPCRDKAVGQGDTVVLSPRATPSVPCAKQGSVPWTASQKPHSDPLENSWPAHCGRHSHKGGEGQPDLQCPAWKFQNEEKGKEKKPHKSPAQASGN